MMSIGACTETIAGAIKAFEKVPELIKQVKYEEEVPPIRELFKLLDSFKGIYDNVTKKAFEEAKNLNARRKSGQVPSMHQTETSAPTTNGAHNTPHADRTYASVAKRAKTETVPPAVAAAAAAIAAADEVSAIPVTATTVTAFTVVPATRKADNKTAVYKICEHDLKLNVAGASVFIHQKFGASELCFPIKMDRGTFYARINTQSHVVSETSEGDRTIPCRDNKEDCSGDDCTFYHISRNQVRIFWDRFLDTRGNALGRKLFMTRSYVENMRKDDDKYYSQQLLMIAVDMSNAVAFILSNMLYLRSVINASMTEDFKKELRGIVFESI